MSRPTWRVRNTVCLFIVLLLTSQCGGSPEPIVEVPHIPSGPEVLSVADTETFVREVIQEKIFDQCGSASPFEAQIQFGRSSGQELEKGIVLEAAAGGQIGISAVASAAISAAIQRHFAEKEIERSDHEEGVRITVPSRTKQAYTLVWRETWHTGAVQYVENGVSSTVNYRYRIGLELVSATGEDLPCAGQELTGPTPVQTSATLYPTYTPYPTSTPYPTYTPWPTSDSSSSDSSGGSLGGSSTEDTLTGTILEAGEAWRQGGISIRLENPNRIAEEPTGVQFLLTLTNNKSHDISFSYSIDSFSAIDNLRRRLSIKYSYYPYFYNCDPQTRAVGAGDSINLSCDYNYFFVELDIGDPAITEVLVTVSEISSVSGAVWRIPVYH